MIFPTVLKLKNAKRYSWIILLLIFAAAFFEPLFGLIGFACFAAPIAVFAVKKRRLVYCSHFCPRGSLLLLAARRLTQNVPLPEFMRTKIFRHIFLIVFAVRFAALLVLSWGDPAVMGYAVIRLFATATLFGIGLGILFVPQAWCQICPMSHALLTFGKRKRKT